MDKIKINFQINAFVGVILMNLKRILRVFVIFIFLIVSSCKTQKTPEQSNIIDIQQPKHSSVSDSQKVIKNETYSLNQIFVLSNPELQKAQFKVIKVYDGDTITISDGFYEIRVRLIGIDTPEMKETNPVLKNLAYQARDYLSSLILNQSIYLQFDHFSEKSMHMDKFGRLLAYIYRYSDNLFINAQMMKMGFSQEYERYPFEQLQYFRELASEARRERRGIWIIINNSKLFESRNLKISSLTFYIPYTVLII